MNKWYFRPNACTYQTPVLKIHLYLKYTSTYITYKSGGGIIAVSIALEDRAH